jgi:hypothetical protein
MSLRPSSLFGKHGARVRRSMSLQKLPEADGNSWENAVALSLELTSEEIQVLDAAHPPPSR